MRIGIELISSIQIVGETAVYTGGTNYAIKILELLTKEKNNRNFDIVLFLPSEYENISLHGLKIDSTKLIIKYVTDITECECEDLNVLFSPQVNGTTLRKLPKLKKKYPELKLCATLHDRQHNYTRYDWNERFYYGGIKRTGLLGWIEYYAKRFIFSIEYGRCIGFVDKVFTVSNFSMQKLMCPSVKEIKYFIQPSIIDDYKKNVAKRKNYILMVGAGRPEKNLLRTLEAFCKYKEETKTDIEFKITGVGKATKEKILRKTNLNLDIIQQYVEFLPYVTYEELAEVYSSCRYVVFTSKGEGYGLPVREALNYGKTVLASRTTSVPEVAGAAVCYCDPFSVDSICQGFKKLESNQTLDKYENYIAERAKIINDLADQDSKILLDELLEG